MYFDNISDKNKNDRAMMEAAAAVVVVIVVSSPMAFPPISYMNPSFHSCYMPCSYHLIHLIIPIILGEEYKL
jgi:hypothetical protein